jgi:hypothetical protein
MARRRKESDSARYARLEKAAEDTRKRKTEDDMIDAAVRESVERHGG